MGTMALRTFLVDDNLTFLTAVCGFLAQLPEVDVIGQSTRGVDALVLLDLALPDVNGIDVGLTLSFWKQPPHIIILSIHDNAGYMALAEKLGALAFVNKADFVSELPVLLGLLATRPPRETCK